MADTNQKNGAEALAQDSQFDPMELIGTQIPFTDPFAFNDNDFRATYYTSGFARCRSTLAQAASQPTLASGLSGAEETLASPHEPQQAAAVFIQLLSSMPLQRTPSFPPAGPVKYQDLADTIPDRAKLTPGQAVRIFQLGKTKTSRTAGELAVEHGITPKAIRDIWTRRSWVQETRPHWNN